MGEKAVAAPSAGPASPQQAIALLTQAQALHNYTLLEERARSAKSVPELLFSLANETWQVMPYRQAMVWKQVQGAGRLSTISGLAQLAEDSPFTVWLKRLGRWFESRTQIDPEFIQVADVPEDLREGWTEWLPDIVLLQPILGPQQQRLGFVCFALDAVPTEAQQILVGRLVSAYAHAWWALQPGRLKRSIPVGRIVAGMLVLAAVACLFVPVRLSVLAPAEVIALDATAISAPMDGVIHQFHVQPNQAVVSNQLLFTLEETTLRNRREVALKQLQVARADAMAAQQKAFDNEASRAELASLNGKVAQQQAEVATIDDQLKRLEVRSPAAGVVVFGDINDWQGKPVVTGERVAQLADPQDAGVMVWLPVADAITLESGASVRLYLHVAPLKPLQATLFQTSYQASLSPDGVSAYRLRARFDGLNEEEKALARIGLKGTAKVYGESAPLGYYLFRRPLATLRELTGL
jgi:multidrug resistance efflux pump